VHSSYQHRAYEVKKKHRAYKQKIAIPQTGRRIPPTWTSVNLVYYPSDESLCVNVLIHIARVNISDELTKLTLQEARVSHGSYSGPSKSSRHCTYEQAHHVRVGHSPLASAAVFLSMTSWTRVLGSFVSSTAIIQRNLQNIILPFKMQQLKYARQPRCNLYRLRLELLHGGRSSSTIVDRTWASHQRAELEHLWVGKAGNQSTASRLGMKTVRIFFDRIRDRIRLEGF
jgi:hypothetical protein